MASNKRLSKRKHSDNENDDTVEEDEFNALELSDEEDGVRIDDIYIPPAPKPACSTHTEGPRLIITKIVNSFFKSYADQQILGPFTKCFNAIVGPNGSGKSNVIDSMLFVFGYRASKIRSKKISVLIHDSPNYRNVQSCTVEVHFGLINDKAGEECKIIPDSEFIVSRTANKDNSSYYQLNNRKVQFKEVAQVLRKYGIDLDHNRFLILQGEVEQIAMMKCKAQNEHETGMLEYLEDVIGTSRYIAPLKKLEERVEILEQKRSEKLCRVKLAEQELNELREPMQEAVNYLKQENNIITNKNILYQKKIYDLEQSVEEIEEKKTEADQQEQELANKLTDIQERKTEKNKMLKEESRTYENLKSKSNSVKEAFNTANNRDAKLQAQMTQLNQTRKRNKELLKAEKKRLDELERVPDENEKEINLCKTREIKLTTEKTDLETKKKEMLSKLQGETQNLYQKKEKLTTKLNTLKVEVNKTKTAFTLAESELKLCVSNEETEKNKLENLRSAYKTTTENISEKTEQVNMLKKKIPLTKKSLQTATAELNANKQKQMQLLSTVQEKRTYVEETKASMQASHSRGKVLDSLMKQKREGNCPGLFGRLGDLGAIDQKYDVAISTACGPLDNIVVDTVNTAQWCIEFLKKHNIGRATFIALEKQEHLRELANSQIKTPENVPRLYDLIKVNDERVKTAFYYALRNTLVANDLEQAPRIAYGAERYRVVTLRGDLIELTGTMSGGGKTVSKGRMGQSVAVTNIQPENLQAVETELHQFEDQLNKLHQEESSLGNQITTLQNELQSMERQYEKLTLELKLLKQEEPQLSSEIKIQDAKLKSAKTNAEQVKKLQKIVEKTKAEYEKASALSDEVEVEVDKITNEINEKVTGKIKAVDMNIMNVTKTIDKCKKEITRLTVAITTAKRDAKNCSENIAMKEQEITDAEEKLRAMKTERDEIEEHSKQLLTCIEDFTEKLVESEEKYNAIKEEMSILTKEENKIKSDKIEVDEKCKVVNKKINDMKVSIHQWKAKIASLKLQDIPDETITALKTFTLEELSEINVDNLLKELQTAEAHIKTAKPNLNSIQDFRKKQEVFIHHSKELNEIAEK